MIKNTIFQINFFSHKKNQFKNIPYYFSKSYNTSDEVLKSSSNQKLIFFLFPFYQARKMVIFNCLHWLVTRFWYFPNCLYIITNKKKKIVFEGNQAKTPSEGNNGGNGSEDNQNWFLVLFLIMKECCCSVAKTLQHI